MQVKIEPGTIRRKYEQTALDDHDVELEPGTYALEPVTIGWKPTDERSAYYFRASIPAKRVHDGARWGHAGDTTIYTYAPYAYTVRDGKGMDTPFAGVSILA
jgi:hypothetical protein